MSEFKYKVNNSTPYGTFVKFKKKKKNKKHFAPSRKELREHKRFYR